MHQPVPKSIKVKIGVKDDVIVVDSAFYSQVFLKYPRYSFNSYRDFSTYMSFLNKIHQTNQI